jgi:hypothetical protein
MTGARTRCGHMPLLSSGVRPRPPKSAMKRDATESTPPLGPTGHALANPQVGLDAGWLAVARPALGPFQRFGRCPGRHREHLRGRPDQVTEMWLPLCLRPRLLMVPATLGHTPRRRARMRVSTR